MIRRYTYRIDEAANVLASPVIYLVFGTRYIEYPRDNNVHEFSTKEGEKYHVHVHVLRYALQRFITKLRNELRDELYV